jgi:hypothetical protein
MSVSAFSKSSFIFEVELGSYSPYEGVRVVIENDISDTLLFD